MDFTLRSVVLGATVLGLVSGTLGAFALLRRQSLLGDALSHAALPGICLGYLVTGARELLPLLAGALLAGVAASLIMLGITRASRVKEDAALGIILSVFFAFGVVLLTYIQGGDSAGQAGLDTFLFGQAAATLPSEVRAMAIVGAVAIGLVLLLWKEMKIVTFDREFAASLGLPVTAIDVLLTALVAFAVVIGLQMVGVVLMSAMLIAPAAAARQWTNRLGVMVTLSALFAAAGGVAGAVLSARGEGLATGPVMVLCVTALVVVSLILAPDRGLLWAGVSVTRARQRLRLQTALVDLYWLAEQHEDPDYPTEVGMMRVLVGRGARAVMNRLVERGWAEPREHMAEEGPHWGLTPAGRREAERILAELDGGTLMLAAYFDSPAALIITVGALVGVASSLVGVFLVLRKTSMLSDAISHSVLLGIVVLFLVVGDIHSPLLVVGAALAGLLTVFLTELLTRSRLVKEDAAIGLVFPALFALAVLLINLYAENVHIDADAVLLGEIAFTWLDAVDIGGYLVPRSILVMGGIVLINAAFVGLFFKELKLSTFDSGLALALGFAPAVLHYALLGLTSVTAVGAFDAVGAILVIAFIVVPPSTAYLLTDRLGSMLAISVAVAVASSFLGYWLAVAFDVNIGGMMACVTGGFFAAAFFFGPRYGLVARELRLRRQRVEHSERMLVVHLFNHASEPNEENHPRALESHLRWSPHKAQSVIDRGLDRGLVERLGAGPNLGLTDRGRILARSIVQP